MTDYTALSDTELADLLTKRSDGTDKDFGVQPSDFGLAVMEAGRRLRVQKQRLVFPGISATLIMAALGLGSIYLIVAKPDLSQPVGPWALLLMPAIIIGLAVLKRRGS